MPRFRRRFVRGSIFREYNRYLPELSLRIMRPASQKSYQPRVTAAASVHPAGCSHVRKDVVANQQLIELRQVLLQQLVISRFAVRTGLIELA